MFDSKKIEHWLDSLQVETHFPNGVPAKVIVPPKSPLDEKMDKYDIFVQGNFSHNHGTSVFPIYGPKPDDKPFNSPMYSPLGGWGWPTYGNIGNIGSFDEEHTTPPVESPHSRLKAKLARMAAVEAVKIVDPAPSTLAVSPDYTHTITAWRGWAATNGMLESLGSNARWEPRRAPKANCFRCGDHAAPSLSCNCGYWSFKTRELLEAALDRYALDVEVVGQVEIWGRVIECENGWRSEYAYPKELWLLDEGMESVSWRYGVPVRRLG